MIEVLIEKKIDMLNNYWNQVQSLIPNTNLRKRKLIIMKVKIWIIMLLLFISTFIMQTICNINLGNTNQRILKKSFSVPIDAFFWNQAIIDDNENLYVGNNTLGVVQKFDRNGKFIESINIKDDIYMIKSEKDEIHVYAG